MVDPTKGIGSVQSFQPVSSSKTQKRDEVKTPERTDAPLSQKALDHGQAEDTAKQMRNALVQSKYHLGLNPSFDEKV